MRSRTHSQGVRWRTGVAALAVFGGAALAVPALAQALPTSASGGNHGQPPPGATTTKVNAPPQGVQPPAGARATTTKASPVGVQPAGPQVRPGPPTHVRGPREKASPRNGHVARRLDKGGVNGASRHDGRLG
jgi:hypothetical protein